MQQLAGLYLDLDRDAEASEWLVRSTKLDDWTDNRRHSSILDDSDG